jgi:hypothetical protein
MPDISLSTDELQVAAMACRVAMALAEQDAKRQENPRIKQSFTDSAARYAELGLKFENARGKC